MQEQYYEVSFLSQSEFMVVPILSSFDRVLALCFNIELGYPISQVTAQCRSCSRQCGEHSI